MKMMKPDRVVIRFENWIRLFKKKTPKHTHATHTNHISTFTIHTLHTQTVTNKHNNTLTTAHAATTHCRWPAMYDHSPTHGLLCLQLTADNQPPASPKQTKHKHTHNWSREPTPNAATAESRCQLTLLREDREPICQSAAMKYRICCATSAPLILHHHPIWFKVHSNPASKNSNFGCWLWVLEALSLW